MSQPCLSCIGFSAAEQAQRQAQEAEGAQQHAAEEESKATSLAQEAEQRAMQEQSKGKLAAAVAASSTAARYAECHWINQGNIEKHITPI